VKIEHSYVLKNTSAHLSVRKTLVRREQRLTSVIFPATYRVIVHASVIISYFNYDFNLETCVKDLNL